MSSDVDDTFSFLGCPGTRADASPLWTCDQVVSHGPRGSAGGSNPHPNPSPDNDIGAEQARPDDQGATSMSFTRQRPEDIVRMGRLFLHGSPLRVVTPSGDLRFAVQALNGVLSSHEHTRMHPVSHCPAPPPSPLHRWLKPHQRVTSSERRTALGWRKRQNDSA
ncbi:hypothetical protein B0H10DRAFT_1943763 [Mycena sp. CBHHK59/15]|nr:hypothetical protein B0H10DRAFT_1943763 [Mycena sp. CBHHK59/15]